MTNYSINAKLNKVLNDIEDSIKDFYQNRETMISELLRYKNEFSKEVDYNYAQYGNLLIYYHDIRALYRNAGYISLERWSDRRIWETYKRQVGYVIRHILQNV